MVAAAVAADKSFAAASDAATSAAVAAALPREDSRIVEHSLEGSSVPLLAFQDVAFPGVAEASFLAVP